MFALIHVANLTIEFIDAAQVSSIETSDAQFVAELREDLIQVPGPVLVTLFNTVAAELGNDPVKRFADKTAASTRLWAALWDLFDKRAADKTAKNQAVDKSVKAKAAERQAKKIVDHSKSNKIIQAAFDAGEFDPMAIAPKARDKAAPAKATDTPAVAPRAPRRTAGINLAPQKKVYPCRAGTKQALLVDLLRSGASMQDLLRLLHPWKEISVKSGLNWDMNKVKGYGIRTTFENGFERWMNCDYESMGSFQLDPSLNGHPDDNTPAEIEQHLKYAQERGFNADDKVAVYHLVLPAGMTEPLAHTPSKKVAAE